MRKGSSRNICGIGVLILSLVFTCNPSSNKPCDIDYLVDFQSNEKPIFHIIDFNRSNEQCQYLTIVDLWDDTVHVYGRGYLRPQGDVIQLRLDSLNSDYSNFLDFSKNIGSNYKFLVITKNNTHEFEMRVDNKVRWEEKKIDVTVFRIKDAFNYFGVKYDIVLLATLKNGIIGSSLMGSYDSVEYMLVPSGFLLLKERNIEDIEVRLLR